MELLETGASKLGIHLCESQLNQFRQYYRVLEHWNSRVNLTSVTGWRDVQKKHFLDSLSVKIAVPEGILESGRFIDIGSGGGFPGMPLKIAFPLSRATLIDSTAKKTAFLIHLKKILKLSNIDVLTNRAESLAHDLELRETFDLVLARGVANMSTLAELTLPYCKTGGIVIAQKKIGVEEEIRQAQHAIETMGGILKEMREIFLDDLRDYRCLVVLKKISPTPVRFPRRPGMPAKRPI